MGTAFHGDKPHHQRAHGLIRQHVSLKSGRPERSIRLLLQSLGFAKARPQPPPFACKETATANLMVNGDDICTTVGDSDGTPDRQWVRFSNGSKLLNLDILD